MARSEEKTSSDKGKVRVRVIEFDLEGSNQTLRDSIRDIVGAIGRSPQVSRAAPAGVLVAPAKTGNGASETEGLSEPDNLEVIEVEPEEDSSDASTRSPRNRTFKSPEILPLDLNTGDKPLKTFIKDVGSPESEVPRYLAMAYWFKVHRGIAEVTADHMHTAFRHLGWQTPDDASRPLRQMKARPYNYVGKGTGRGAYAINHIGENKILELLNKDGSGSA